MSFRSTFWQARGGDLTARLEALVVSVRGEVDAVQDARRSALATEDERFKTTRYVGRGSGARSVAKASVRRLRRKVGEELPAQFRPLQGEILLRDFVASEAVRCGVKACTIYRRMSMGDYPGVETRKINERFIYVTVHALPPAVANRFKPLPGEISMKEFTASESQRLGVSGTAIYNRMKRGKYAHLHFRRVTQRLVYVGGFHEE